MARRSETAARRLAAATPEWENALHGMPGRAIGAIIVSAAEIADSAP
jgi:hypothetical protein